MHVMVSSNCIDASVGSVEICISFSATKHKIRQNFMILADFFLTFMILYVQDNSETGNGLICGRMGA